VRNLKVPLLARNTPAPINNNNRERPYTFVL
jgi:hypothetical protein